MLFIDHKPHAIQDRSMYLESHQHLNKLIKASEGKVALPDGVSESHSKNEIQVEVQVGKDDVIVPQARGRNAIQP